MGIRINLPHALWYFIIASIAVYVLLKGKRPLPTTRKQTDSSAEILLTTRPSKAQQEPDRFAVISATIPMPGDYNYYAFLIPLTALAWERIGFRTIVFLMEPKELWLDIPAMNHMLSFLKERDAVTVFLDGSKNSKWMLSQTSRLFAASLCPFLNDDDYLLTADADQWPLSQSPFLLPEERKLLLLDCYHGDDFEWRNGTYRMLNMMNNGASVATWRDILTTDSNATLPRTAAELVEYFRQDFGDIAASKIRRGHNTGGYTSEAMDEETGQPYSSLETKKFEEGPNRQEEMEGGYTH